MIEPTTVSLADTCARLSPMAVTLSGNTLTLEELLAVARGGATVELAAEVPDRVRAGQGDRRALARRRRSRSTA